MAKWSRMSMEVDYQGNVWERSYTSDGRRYAKIESHARPGGGRVWVLRTYDVHGYGSGSSDTYTHERKQGEFDSRVEAEAYFNRHKSKWSEPEGSRDPDDDRPRTGGKHRVRAHDRSGPSAGHVREHTAKNPT